MALIFGGLCFKITAVPFHFYAPDVYQGTTYPNAALLSVIPKAAGLVALMRLLLAAMPGMELYGWRAAVAISVLTDDRGQRAGTLAGRFAPLAGLFVDRACGLHAHWPGRGACHGQCARGLERPGSVGILSGKLRGGHDWRIRHLGTLGPAGTAHRGRGRIGRPRSNAPLAAALLAVFLFSLTGVPLLAGFWGKLWLFGSALNIDGTAGAAADMQGWFTGLAVVGVLNAAVAAAYYLRVVAIMYFRTPLATPRAQGGAGAWWAAVACGVAVVLIGLFPGPLMRETQRRQWPASDDRPSRSQPGTSAKSPPPQSAPSPGVAVHPAVLSRRAR